jgi:outer membrane protein assembly factor BamB
MIHPRVRSGATSAAVGLLFILSTVTPALAENWPGFRGPTGQGVSGERGLPASWSATENVAWKAEVPGEGWSSPIVWADRVFVTAATEDGTSCRVICFARRDGKLLWNTEVFKQENERKQEKNSLATPTPVTDGRRVYAFFGGGGAAAVNFDGNVEWTNTNNKFYSQHGLGASPILYKDLLFMPWDHSIRPAPGVDAKVGWQVKWDESYVWALDKNTGKERYKAMRKQSRIAHMTPQIAEVDGKPQLISAAGDVIDAFDPETGRLIWWVTTGGEGVTPSPVIGDGVVYSSSGFPTNVPYAAIRAHKLGGTGDVTRQNLLWEQKKGVPMIPSFVLANGLLFMVTEKGIAQCVDPADGKILWTQRLEGTFSASPVATARHVGFLNEEGNATIIEAAREFKEVASNALNDGPCQASPAISDGQIFIRTAKHLYCIGAKDRSASTR